MNGGGYEAQGYGGGYGGGFGGGQDFTGDSGWNWVSPQDSAVGCQGLPQGPAGCQGTPQGDGLLPIPSHIYAGEPLVFQDQNLASLADHMSSIPYSMNPLGLDTGPGNPLVNPSVQVPLELVPFTPPDFTLIRPDMFGPSTMSTMSSLPKHDLVWHFGV